jgi:hypothetical protein
MESIDETNIEDFELNIDTAINKLKNFESLIFSEIKKIDTLGEKWYSLDDKKNIILSKINEEDDMLKLIIGGKEFITSVRTILSINDNIFYNLILIEDIDFKNGISINRFPTYFPYILTYLRHKTLQIENIPRQLLHKIKEDALFYEVIPLVELIEFELNKFKVVAVEASGQYFYNNASISNNRLENISNTQIKSGMKGIVTNSPGWIIFQLNKLAEIKTIYIMGYKGNSSFSPGNGNGAKIFIGTDKANWKEIGIIPASFSTDIVKVTVHNHIGNCVKFQSTGYLGLGYFLVE